MKREDEFELAAAKRQIATLKAVISNDTETEEDAKRIARRVLSDMEVYGDSYGVPTLADIVEKLVEKYERQTKKEQG